MLSASLGRIGTLRESRRIVEQVSSGPGGEEDRGAFGGQDSVFSQREGGPTRKEARGK